MKPELIERVAVTFEMCGGQKLSTAAKELVIESLENYSESEITTALKKCCVEVRGRLAVADIVQRIPKDPNGRPSADEAFAMLPFSESQSVVWTKEMAEAFYIVRELAESDMVGARMAFRETYNRLCLEAESYQLPVRWEVSLGHYAAGRERVLSEAVEKGRLTLERARKWIPELNIKEESIPALSQSTGLSKAITDEKACLIKPPAGGKSK
jgi:hypothetical protein